MGLVILIFSLLAFGNAQAADEDFLDKIVAIPEKIPKKESEAVKIVNDFSGLIQQILDGKVELKSDNVLDRQIFTDILQRLRNYVHEMPTISVSFIENNLRFVNYDALFNILAVINSYQVSQNDRNRVSEKLMFLKGIFTDETASDFWDGTRLRSKILFNYLKQPVNQSFSAKRRRELANELLDTSPPLTDDNGRELSSDSTGESAALMYQTILSSQQSWFANALLSRFIPYNARNHKGFINDVVQNHVVKLLQQQLKEAAPSSTNPFNGLFKPIPVEAVHRQWGDLEPFLQNVIFGIFVQYFANGDGSQPHLRDVAFGLKIFLVHDGGSSALGEGLDDFIALYKAVKRLRGTPQFADPALKEFLDVFDKFVRVNIKILPIDIKDALHGVSQRIYSDLPKYGKAAQALSVDRRFTVITNNDGFKNTDEVKINKDCEDQCVQGAPLILKKGSYSVDGKDVVVENDKPIGYAITLPASKVIKGIIVKVYGGGILGDLAASFSYPAKTDALERSLLDKGIAVVSTNLVDLMELNVEQDEMTEQFYLMLQLCVHELYSALRNAKTISPMLNGLFDDKNIVLFGQSFGGMFVARHAELFSNPKTFDGYVSHDGGLSYEVGVAADLPTLARKMTPEQIAAANHLSPLTEPINAKSRDEKLAKIRQPLLLMHNFDDNNVNVFVSKVTVERAIASGVGDLVRLFITRKGNTSLYPIEKGHVIPTAKRELSLYSSTLADFVIAPKHSPEQLAESSAQMSKLGLLAMQNYKGASVDEKFVSAAYRLYLYRDQKDSDTCTLHPSWRVFDAKNRLDYERLYFLMAHLKSLKETEKLGDAMKSISVSNSDDVRRLLTLHKRVLATYLGELNLLPRAMAESMLETRLDEVVKQYIKLYGEPGSLDDEFVSFLLYSYYLTTPLALDTIVDAMKAQPDVVQRKDDAIKSLEEKIVLGDQLMCVERP